MIRQDGAGVRELVGRRDEQPGPGGLRQVPEVALLPALPRLLQGFGGISALPDDCRHGLAEVPPDVGEPRLPSVVLGRVVQQGGDDGILVPAVAHDDGADVEQVGDVGNPGALPDVGRMQRGGVVEGEPEAG